MPNRRNSGGVEQGEPWSTQARNETESIDATVASLADIGIEQLRLQWRNHLGGVAPAHLPRWLLMRVLAHRIQTSTLGDLDKATQQIIGQAKGEAIHSPGTRPFATRGPTMRDGTSLKSGALLVREWKGKLERVTILQTGFAWNGRTFGSLSQIAKAITGTSWNGHRFFGLRPAKGRGAGVKVGGAQSIAAPGSISDCPPGFSHSEARDEPQTLANRELLSTDEATP